MFARTLATSARSMTKMTTPLASSTPAMSRYFSASASVAVHKIFIGGLSWNVGEVELKEHFERFGDISDVHIPINQEGKPRGFAFLEFSDNQAENETSETVMNNAIAECDQTEIDGRRVTVKEAEARKPREDGFSRGGYGGGRGGGYGRDGRGGGGYGRGDRRGGGGGYGGGRRDNYGGGGRDNYGGDY